MATIYQYTKFIDNVRTITIKLPDGAGETELATIDGVTYVSVPDGVALPEQPPEITVTQIVVDDVIRGKLRSASPHLRLIDKRLVERIRDRYSIDDELYLARIAVGAQLGTYQMEADEPALLADYQAWVESCRQWAREQRAALGL